MPAIQVLLFSCWLLVACSHCDGAALAIPDLVDAENSTVQTSVEKPIELEQSTIVNSTSNTTTQCPKRVMETLQEDSRQARLVNIRDQILAKFGLQESPVDPGSLNISQSMNETSLVDTYYELISRHSGQQGGNEECGGRKGGRSTFYAKELRVHFPASFHAVVPRVEMFEWGSLFKSGRSKRNAESKGNGKPPEKESNKNHGDNGKSPNPGSNNGPLPTESPTVSENRQPYSEAQLKVLQGYIAPLVYKLTFSDLALGQSESAMEVSAELRLFKRKKILDNPQIKQDTNPSEKVEIFRVWNSTSRSGMEFRFVTSQSISSERDEFVAFNVTDAVNDWQSAQNQSHSLSFEILVRSPQSITTGLSFLPSIEFDVPGFGKGEHNAQLIIAVTALDEDISLAPDANPQNVTKRLKRQSESESIDNQHCRNNPGEPNCCLRELIIDFHRDLNMTWVLAPRSYQVNYCEGLCPDYWPTATYSTDFLISFRKNNPLAAPEPCCIAASTTPLIMVVVINNRIYFNYVPEMIINSCICR